MKRNVIALAPDDTVQTAARGMRDAGVGFLPVCDSDKRVLGVITDRDITVRLVADNRPADTAVSTIMTPEVVACAPTDSVSLAAQLMRENHTSRVMCVDDDERLVGVISLSDLAQWTDAESIATLRQVSEREQRP